MPLRCRQALQQESARIELGAEIGHVYLDSLAVLSHLLYDLGESAHALLASASAQLEKTRAALVALGRKRALLSSAAWKGQVDGALDAHIADEVWLEDKLKAAARDWHSKVALGGGAARDVAEVLDGFERGALLAYAQFEKLVQTDLEAAKALGIMRLDQRRGALASSASTVRLRALLLLLLTC